MLTHKEAARYHEALSSVFEEVVVSGKDLSIVARKHSKAPRYDSHRMAPQKGRTVVLTNVHACIRGGFLTSPGVRFDAHEETGEWTMKPVDDSTPSFYKRILYNQDTGKVIEYEK